MSTDRQDLSSTSKYEKQIVPGDHLADNDAPDTTDGQSSGSARRSAIAGRSGDARDVSRSDDSRGCILNFAVTPQQWDQIEKDVLKKQKRRERDRLRKLREGRHNGVKTENGGDEKEDGNNDGKDNSSKVGSVAVETSQAVAEAGAIGSVIASMNGQEPETRDGGSDATY